MRGQLSGGLETLVRSHSVRGGVRAGSRWEVEGGLVLTLLTRSLTYDLFPLKVTGAAGALSSTANMTRRGPAAVLSPQSPVYSMPTRPNESCAGH